MCLFCSARTFAGFASKLIQKNVKVSFGQALHGKVVLSQTVIVRDWFCRKRQTAPVWNRPSPQLDDHVEPTGVEGRKGPGRSAVMIWAKPEVGGTIQVLIEAVGKGPGLIHEVRGREAIGRMCRLPRLLPLFGGPLHHLRVAFTRGLPHPYMWSMLPPLSLPLKSCTPLLSDLRPTSCTSRAQRLRNPPQRAVCIYPRLLDTLAYTPRRVNRKHLCTSHLGGIPAKVYGRPACTLLTRNRKTSLWEGKTAHPCPVWKCDWSQFRLENNVAFFERKRSFMRCVDGVCHGTW